MKLSGNYSYRNNFQSHYYSHCIKCICLGGEGEDSSTSVSVVTISANTDHCKIVIIIK